MYRIHPSFRLIGLAEPPQINSSQNQWLNSELLPLFLYHHIEPLEKNEEAEIVFKMVYCHFISISFKINLEVDNLPVLVRREPMGSIRERYIFTNAHGTSSERASFFCGKESEKKRNIRREKVQN